nr:MAG TPA: crossover junction endodeoxyribonuclease [Caudoviricetes sp.]
MPRISKRRCMRCSQRFRTFWYLTAFIGVAARRCRRAAHTTYWRDTGQKLRARIFSTDTTPITVCSGRGGEAVGTILAIDPGNMESGYVLVEHDGKEIRKVLDVGKVPNGEIFPVLCREYQHLAIEMVAGMGMPVGQEVFDTCFWIGRFWEYAELYQQGYQIQKIFRREEKLYLCGRASTKDANIRQALVDRYAPGQPNYGKGTRKNPGFFYGFAADMWAAMAVATTYFDKYIRGVKL